ncbi:MAG TPA: helix-hairpin-helix domain-containing protein, partial [Solirubrobacterales bacterium]|nr:helix-hairpin-helix domain-containing protein [Solirubrobacterales bacterium]
AENRAREAETRAREAVAGVAKPLSAGGAAGAGPAAAAVPPSPEPPTAPEQTPAVEASTAAEPEPVPSEPEPAAAEPEPQRQPEPKPEREPEPGTAAPMRLPEPSEMSSVQFLPLNLNDATFEQLRDVGLSVTQTGRVLAHRERSGHFASVDELEGIPGFPRDFLEQIKSRLTV